MENMSWKAASRGNDIYFLMFILFTNVKKMVDIFDPFC